MLLLSCWLANSCNPLSGSSFTGLGFLPGCFDSSASACSDDGVVIVGNSSNQAFRWTVATGMIGLGYLPGASASSADAVSSDGSVVVGVSRSRDDSEAFRWTAAGMVGLGKMAGAYCRRAAGVSGDGSIVIGWNDRDHYSEAFRWTATSGMVGLGVLPEAVSSFADGISRDGSVIVGLSLLGAGKFQPCVWTTTNGVTSAVRLLETPRSGSARGVSRDGSVIVGDNDSSGEAFRWTKTDGMISLGHLRNDNLIQAWAVSSDGAVVLGRSMLPTTNLNFVAPKSSPPPDFEGFIWDSVNGIRNLQSVLTNEYKLHLNGWKKIIAVGISADKKTIVGNGNRYGHDEAWVAHLDRPLNAPVGKERGK